MSGAIQGSRSPPPEVRKWSDIAWVWVPGKMLKAYGTDQLFSSSRILTNTLGFLRSLCVMCGFKD